MSKSKRIPAFTVVTAEKTFSPGGHIEPTLRATEQVGPEYLIQGFRRTCSQSQIAGLTAWAKTARVGDKITLTAAHVVVFVFCHS